MMRAAPASGAALHGVEADAAAADDDAVSPTVTLAVLVDGADAGHDTAADEAPPGRAASPW